MTEMQMTRAGVAPVRQGLLWAALLTTTAITAPVVHAQEVTTLTPIVVEASEEEAGGPVEGYTATRSGSATKSDTPLAETPVAVSVVTADLIEDQGANSVAEALRYVPGTFSEYRGTSNLHDEASLRGLGDRAFATKFLDGLLMGQSSMGQLDPYYLERVEVVKGPASLTYGQVVPGGVIAQFSKRPTEAGGNEVVAGLGSDGYQRISADLQGDLNAEGTARYRIVTSAWRQNLQNELDQSRFLLAPSVTVDLTEATSLTVSALYQNEPDAGHRGFLPLTGTLEPTSTGYMLPQDFVSFSPAYDKATRETFALGYDLEHAFDNGLSLHHSARATRIDATQRGATLWSHSSSDGYTFPIYVFDSSDELTQLSTDTYVEGDFLTGGVDHHVVAGLDYSWSELNSAYARDDGSTLEFDFSTLNYISYADATSVTLDGYTSTTDTTMQQTGVYVQDQMRFGNWGLLLGGRYDWVETDVAETYAASWGSGASEDSYSQEAFSGRAALSYDFGNGLMSYVSYSTSFEPVTELDDDGNASFDPTTGEQWELGAKWLSADGNVMLSAALFDIKKKNIVETVDLGGGLSESQQVGQISSTGIELEAHARLSDRLSVVAGYFKADPRYDSGDYEGNQMHIVPLESASLWVKYGVNDHVDASLGIRQVGKTWGDQENTVTVPEYTLVDLGLEADLAMMGLEGMTAQLNVQNLADKRYVTSCAFGRYCWLGEGRTVQASLTYQW
ncbi:TonB-dependent siderophore receptor [Oceanicola sp. S124]|uniref:TonB-dependent siderophore receptor n=1 Tax=Oceanicola sp. S124 TaxID=1042378 RepID=UPI000255891A|nr:TonB-dependent siderophore receptor [Oceanicola sp. S124]